VISTYRVERAAAVVSIIALALWVGGLVALGACAAPIVFRVVPAPLSGDAMGAVFRRFDAVAISCAVALLASEAVRIRVAAAPASIAARTRTALAIVGAAAAIYGGARLSPAIMALHAAGAVRGFGPEGAELERLHGWAEAVAKVEVCVGLVLLALHVVTLADGEENAS
jgi:hypothetical protein